jgi:membrane-associated phospholipid phosphatase
MLETIDQQVFFFINHRLHTESLDLLFPFWRSQYFWLPLYAFFIAYLFSNFTAKKASIYLLALSLTVGLADIISSRAIKKTVQRPRPCNDLMLKDKVKLLVPCGGGYSFTSSHATNHFAAATFVLLTVVNFWRKNRLLGRSLLIFWATSISFGQVYVGVHYPLDVIGGGILGVLMGRLGSFFYKKYGRELLVEVV